MDQLKGALDGLGLQGKTSTVYMTLLQMGSGTVSEIAAHSKIKRTTVYDCLDELTTRDLLTCSFRGKRKIYIASDPSSLKTFPSKQLKLIDQHLPELNALFRSSERKPRLEYHEGQNGIIRVHEEILASSPGEYYYFGSEIDIVNATGLDYMKEYVKRRIEKGIWSYAIRTRGGEGRNAFLKGGNKNLREVRYISGKSDSSTACITMYPHKVAIMSTLDEAYALVIESQECYHMMMMLWQTIWNSVASNEKHP